MTVNVSNKILEITPEKLAALSKTVKLDFQLGEIMTMHACLLMYYAALVTQQPMFMFNPAMQNLLRILDDFEEILVRAEVFTEQDAQIMREIRSKAESQGTPTVQ